MNLLEVSKKKLKCQSMGIYNVPNTTIINLITNQCPSNQNFKQPKLCLHSQNINFLCQIKLKRRYRSKLKSSTKKNKKRMIILKIILRTLKMIKMVKVMNHLKVQKKKLRCQTMEIYTGLNSTIINQLISQYPNNWFSKPIRLLHSCNINFQQKSKNKCLKKNSNNHKLT